MHFWVYSLFSYDQLRFDAKLQEFLGEIFVHRHVTSGNISGEVFNNEVKFFRVMSG
jgi:hypothetical protein